MRTNKREKSFKIFYDKKERESSLNSLRLLLTHPRELLCRSIEAVPTLPTIAKEYRVSRASATRRSEGGLFRGKASGAKPATSGNQDFAELIANEKRNLSLSLRLSAWTSPVNSSEMTGPRFRVYLIRGKAGNSFNSFNTDGGNAPRPRVSQP